MKIIKTKGKKHKAKITDPSWGWRMRVEDVGVLVTHRRKGLKKWKKNPD